MIPYAPGYWGCWFVFFFKGSVLPKSFAIALPCGIIAFILHWSFHEKHFEDWSAAKAGVQIASGFTFVLGFLIVFRMNQAYSRWWEGGSLLLQVRGEWFNSYSSVMALCNPNPDKAMEVVKFQHCMVRLMSLLYGTAILQLHTVENPVVEIIDMNGFDKEHLQFLAECHDKVEVVFQWVQKVITAADRSGVIQGAPPIVTRVYNQLASGMAAMSNSRKIGEFPMPFPVVQMITCMLQISWIVTPILAAIIVGDSVWAAFMTFISIMVLFSINYVAAELEMPFGEDMNDLPLQHLQADMNASLMALLHPKAMYAPDFEMQLTKAGNAVPTTAVLEVTTDGTLLFSEKADSARFVDNRPQYLVHKASFFAENQQEIYDSSHPAFAFHTRRIVSGKHGTHHRGPTPEAIRKAIVREGNLKPLPPQIEGDSSENGIARGRSSPGCDSYASRADPQIEPKDELTSNSRQLETGSRGLLDAMPEQVSAAIAPQDVGKESGQLQSYTDLSSAGGRTGPETSI